MAAKPTSPTPDPIDARPGYTEARAGHPDWDVTAATEGGARSDASGSQIYSDRKDAPLLANESSVGGLLSRLRHRLARLWERS